MENLAIYLRELAQLAGGLGSMPLRLPQSYPSCRKRRSNAEESDQKMTPGTIAELDSIVDRIRQRTTDCRMSFAVGDIHGHDAAAVVALQFFERIDGLVVLLGDYVDRGPASLRTLEVLSRAQRGHPEWIFLMGNHEDMLIRMLRSGIEESIAKHDLERAPRPVLLECRDQGGFPEEFTGFLESLKLFHETESFLYVHSGIGSDATLPLDKHDILDLTKHGVTDYRWRGKRIVHGHIVVKEPLDDDSHINLDTSCYRHGWLTIGCLNEDTAVMEGWVQISADGERAVLRGQMSDDN